MSSQRRPAPDFDPELVSHLDLKIYALPDHSHWAWQLLDARDATVFETQLPYKSWREARQAGLERLAELTPSLPGAKASARTGPTPAKGHLIVVARHESVVYDFLKHVFADSDGIDVIQDRRRAAPAPFRTEKDRRAALVVAEAQGKGWWMVGRSEVEPTFGPREESA